MKIITDRLRMVPLTVDLVDALIAGDAAEMKHAAGAEFGSPLELPPLVTRDELGEMREQIDRGARGFKSFLLLDKESGEAVGIAGLSPSGDPGTSTIGYSIYPRHEGKGYATEAARALMREAFDNGDRLVRATIPPGHDSSIRVAEKVGMQRAGTAVDTEVGEVLVFEAATG